MNTFTLLLRAAQHEQRIEGVSAFIGEDASGSFGLLARHARFLTALEFGLARFRVGEEPWRYLAVPRALVYFVDNQLTLTTRHYVLDDDYERISRTLQEELLAEEQALRSVRNSLRIMEEYLLKRLWQVGRQMRSPA
ncbi:MAG: ATP synthase F0F1 subunit epsilon [Betaproteobacteria bacterium SG8_40]|jgi:F-type H+-transporting ATPase subunit epsilon|nr:MAG: ATP synthase F0F1 subunit epsilon [Betaproteobacteria bacterium SG8_40]